MLRLTARQRAFIFRTSNTPRRLVALVLGSWATFGVLFAVLQPGVGLFDALYLGTVVQSTLGFGDVLPTTAPTKILVMLYVWFCLYFVLPAAIFHVGDSFLASRNAFSEQEQAIVKGALLLLLQDRLRQDTIQRLTLDDVAAIACRAAKECAHDDREHESA